MNKIKFLIIFTIMIGTLQMSYAQENESNRELKVSDDEKIILFAGFSIAVIAIFLFLARDVILRKKQHTINKNMNQKKTKHMKNIIQTGEMIMRKLAKEATVNKIKNTEIMHQPMIYQIIMKF